MRTQTGQRRFCINFDARPVEGPVWKSFLGDDAAALAPSSDEEPASPRHRAGVASMACVEDDAAMQHERAEKFDFHTVRDGSRNTALNENTTQSHLSSK